ncbi:MAG: bifunctional ADP-dependent NAD(P)H-hydrate dehydratase/NAD(P)H-hydrate epimerase [Promethearchaeota archaeon]
MNFLDEKITSAEMARRDRNAAWWGIPTELLMENAGRAVANEIAADEEVARGGRVVAFCGTGNNGGDGFVAARHLAAEGFDATVLLCGDAARLSTELASRNWQRVRRLKSVSTVECRTVEALERAVDDLGPVDAAVDALLGTGVRGRVREPIATAISLFNGLDRATTRKYAVDVPSGMDPDTGRAGEPVARVDVVVTFHRAKAGMPDSCEHYDRMVVRGIGIPPEAVTHVGPGDVARHLPPRRPDAHKGDHGRVVVVGGSARYSGAPTLAGLAALRGGADLAVVAVPTAVELAVRCASPDLVVAGVPGEYHLPGSASRLSRELGAADAVVVGPGAGDGEDVLEGVAEVVAGAVDLGKPVVVDADGLKALKMLLDRGWRPGREGGPVVVTPHAGEFAACFDRAVGRAPPSERAGAAAEAAAKFGLTVLLKGPVDVASDGTTTRFNATGTPAMTVGGTGDVLAGLVGAFLARRVPPVDAAALAAFVNGLAGERAESELGPNVVATDVLERVQPVLQDLGSGEAVRIDLQG